MLQDYSNKEDNREKLAAFLNTSPKATHVYFRREDGVLVDIPVGQAEGKIINKPKWRIEGVAGGITVPLSLRPQPKVELPPKPSEQIAEKDLEPAPQNTENSTEQTLSTKNMDEGIAIAKSNLEKDNETVLPPNPPEGESMPVGTPLKAEKPTKPAKPSTKKGK